MAAIGERARLLRAGAWLVTLTKRVPDPPDGAPVLRLVLKTELRMSWASASVYIQQRV